MTLADELLLLTLDPAAGLNMRAHDGIRAAVCGANVLDHWFAGGPVPGDLKRFIADNHFESLEPVLRRLAATGQIQTRAGKGVLGSMFGAQNEILLNVEAGTAIRRRLQAALSGPGLPSAWDAGLAVLLYEGRLWNPAQLEPYTLEEVRVFGRRQPARTPLKRRAEALANGQVRIPQDPAGVLPALAKAVDWVYIHYSD
jgi:hypothetical protein